LREESFPAGGGRLGKDCGKSVKKTQSMTIPLKGKASLGWTKRSSSNFEKVVTRCRVFNKKGKNGEKGTQTKARDECRKGGWFQRADREKRESEKEEER